jgi:small subunit ribosomal protein S17
MQIRIKERIMKDVRSAAKGRMTSEQRLVQARKQGFEIPDLETAMKNVRLAEEAERSRNEGKKGKGKTTSNLDAKRKRMKEAKMEKAAKAKLKAEKKQTAAAA